ncbi:hypothetical protein VYE96_12460 [Fusobacterium pseudoperiodonticum]|nr:hypothetical protein [Fusobacterium pseudoperiodonticum]
MIKNSFKFIILTILVIIANACSSNSNSFWGFKPHFSTGTYIHSYAIIEDGKVNRMGIPKKDIDKMDSIINDKYGIQFIDNRIYALKGGGENYKIKFYNDFKMTVNGKEYIMSKEKIRQSVYNTYHYDLPIKIKNTNYNEYILDIGEIEIIDTDGKIIRPRTKIPPILFKKTIYRTFVNDITGSDYDVYYRGWAEDYPKDPSTLKKMYNSIEEMQKSFKESKKK